MKAAPKFSLLYEDDALLVVDKAAGLLVIPGPESRERTLGELLEDWYRKGGRPKGAASPAGAAPDLNPNRFTAGLHPCHRIDRETSGIVVYAKGKALQKAVMAQFKNRDVKKAYLAVVLGKMGKDRGSLTYPIDGQEARSDYSVLRSCDDFSLVRVYPETGRTNQIRIHFAKAGHPLLGDAKFGRRKDFTRPCKRAALHAWGIVLNHPEKSAPVRFEAGIPADLGVFVRELGLDPGLLKPWS